MNEKRFQNVAEALRRLSSERPEIQSEVQIARDIIFGKRPGIEEKYDALLLKLDRTYSQLLDKRDSWQKTADTTPLFHTRKKAQAKVSAFNAVLSAITWMRARNRDMIEAAGGHVGEHREC